MNTLKQYLEDYKNITIELINNLYCDKLDDIDDFMQKRQSILEEIGQLNFSKKEFNLIANEIELPEIEKRLKDVMTEKKEKLKIEIEKISLSKNANNSYNKNLYGKSQVFSKKI
ncbi:flagellar protein FliT [Clostridium pasteurianum]|uniref:flagellar protein FliT n=1 Tax=Clostridium pasteurianum TaxID=1501 RepID=UPI002260C00F|nr:flagellar protein FliT [Clostridium pasteurianum]UZW16006.1 flagellar protein FliT [Clostridium pasteurianum]